MSLQTANNNKEHDKEATFTLYPKQRAIVFQGGGALGAYEAGVYRVLYDWISGHIENMDKKVLQ